MLWKGEVAQEEEKLAIVTRPFVVCIVHPPVCLPILSVCLGPANS